MKLKTWFSTPGERAGAVLTTALLIGFLILSSTSGSSQVAETGAVPVTAVRQEDKALRQELERLQRELLKVPKRRRYRFGGDNEMTYDGNRDATRIGDNGKGETTFRIKPFLGYDLSGRKTDVKLEYGWSRIYGVKTESSDTLDQDVTLRFQRKLFKKTTLALNDRFSLKSQRSTSIEEKRLTWSQSHRQSLTHDLTRKLQIVLESDYSRTDNPHEEFDQDTNYTYAVSPTVFFQVTPKSRLSAAYRMSWTRTVGNEAGDTTTHQIRGTYSFRVTQKSSATFDLGYQIQSPDSAGATTSDQTLVGVAYIFQMTPKTSTRFNYSRTFQDSTADSVTTLVQTGSETASDSLGLGLSLRPHRRVGLEFAFNGSHSRTKTSAGDATGSKTRSWTLPFQAAMNLSLAQWISFNVSYTYSHQLTDEKATNEVRDHALVVTSNMNF